MSTAALDPALAPDPRVPWLRPRGPDARRLAERLLGIRRRYGLTQAALAARLGRDEKQVRHWERGSRTPHPWIAGRIECALWILEWRPAEGGHGLPAYFDLTRWRRRPPSDALVAPSTYGERLRHRRLERGLSMVGVAGWVGASWGTLHRLERDRQRPSEPVRRALGRALGAPAG